jgi:hypothetical protein
MNILSTFYERVHQQEICRIRTNKQLREFYKILGLVINIKRRRVEWLRHVIGPDQTWMASEGRKQDDAENVLHDLNMERRK